SFCCWSLEPILSWRYGSDNGTLRFRHSIYFRKFFMNGIQSDSQEASFNCSVGNQLLVKKFCFIWRYGETDTVVITSRRSNLRIHSNHFATHVDERTATVSPVN